MNQEDEESLGEEDEESLGEEDEESLGEEDEEFLGSIHILAQHSEKDANIILSYVEGLRRPLRERLAEIEHEQWVSWSKAVIAELIDETGPYDLIAIRDKLCKMHQRWLLKWKPYNELSEEDKEKDRVWADKVIVLVNRGIRIPYAKPCRKEADR